MASLSFSIPTSKDSCRLGGFACLLSARNSNHNYICRKKREKRSKSYVSDCENIGLEGITVVAHPTCGCATNVIFGMCILGGYTI